MYSDLSDGYCHIGFKSTHFRWCAVGSRLWMLPSQCSYWIQNRCSFCKISMNHFTGTCFQTAALSIWILSGWSLVGFQEIGDNVSRINQTTLRAGTTLNDCSISVLLREDACWWDESSWFDHPPKPVHSQGTIRKFVHDSICQNENNTDHEQDFLVEHQEVLAEKGPAVKFQQMLQTLQVRFPNKVWLDHSLCLWLCSIWKFWTATWGNIRSCRKLYSQKTHLPPYRYLAEGQKIPHLFY